MPVDYVAVVQATLCAKLGADSVVANLPASAFLQGSFAPIIVSRLVPHRLERSALVWSYVIIASSMVATCLTLFLPFACSVRLVVVIAQGLVYGLAGSTALVYMYQCSGRGTTTQGRANARKVAFTWSPVAAIAGALGAQLVLDHGIPFLAFPSDFGLLYVVGAICAACVALASSRFELMPVEDEKQAIPLARYILETAKSYFRIKPLALLWVAYALSYSTLFSMPDLSLILNRHWEYNQRRFRASPWQFVSPENRWPGSSWERLR